MNQVQLDLEEGMFMILYILVCVCVTDVDLRLYRVKSADKQVNSFINVL